MKYLRLRKEITLFPIVNFKCVKTVLVTNNNITSENGNQQQTERVEEEMPNTRQISMNQAVWQQEDVFIFLRNRYIGRVQQDYF